MFKESESLYKSNEFLHLDLQTSASSRVMTNTAHVPTLTTWLTQVFLLLVFPCEKRRNRNETGSMSLAYETLNDVQMCHGSCTQWRLEVWLKRLVMQARSEDAHWSKVENLSLGSIQRSPASWERLITELLGQNIRVFTLTNIFIYSTLAFYGEIEAQISHAGCITNFSEWLMQVVMQAEGRAVWI